jgi:ATP-dependent Clp protease ATP-binding subunit ClpA
MLARFGTDLTRKVLDPQAEPTVGRAQAIERVVTSLSSWQARLTLVEGESGIGKTNLLHAVARKLAEHRPGSRLIMVNLGVLLAGTICDSDRENTLSLLFHEIAGDSDRLVLAMEHLETAFLHTPGGALLVEQALDDGLRFVGTAVPRSLPGAVAGILSGRLDVVRLEELDAAATSEVLNHLLGRIARHHGVRIDASIVGPAVERAASLAGCFPSKAISLLDSAAARASLLGAAEVELFHIYLAGGDLPAIDAEP